MSKPVPHFAVTANRLLDGLVLYVGPGPAWTTEIAAAELTTSAERRDELLAWATSKRLEVCGPYVIDVGVIGGELRLTQRERLRAAGPEQVLERLHMTPPELAARTKALALVAPSTNEAG